MSKSPIVLSTLLLLSASAYAVSIQEGFDYSANDDLSGGNTGTGFDTAWSGSSNMDVFDYVWSTWPGYTVLSDKAIGPDDNGDVAVQVNRSFTSDIDSETSPAIYFSYTLNADADDPGWTNFILRAAGSDTAKSDANNVFIQYSGSDFFLRGESAATPSALTRGADYLIVGKITFAAGQDTLEFSVFDSAGDLGTLEAGFQISASPTITGLLDQLTIRMNNSSRLGNLRFGDTLEDVGIDLPLISEGFIYDVGPVHNEDGGSGFSGAWNDRTGSDDKMLVFDYTWSTWTNYLPLAGKAIGPATNGDTGIEANRQLAASIDTETGPTLYFSYTLNGDIDDPGWTNFVVRTASGSTTQTNDVDSFVVQYNGGSFSIVGNAGNSSDTTDRTQDYLIVGFIDFEVGQDSSGVSVFAPGQDAQAVYTAFESTAAPTLTGTLTELLLRMNNSSRVGNIRFGTTLEEVGVVPPPPPPSRDPIVHFSFDNGTVVGGVVQDQSGNGNDGTLTNVNQTVRTGEAGAAGEAFFFPYADADQGVVTLPSGIVPSGNAPRSFACWFRQINDPEKDSETAQNKIFGYGNQSADPGTTGLESFDVSLRYDSINSENDIEIRGWGGTHQSRDAGPRYEDEEEWKHLAIVVPDGATTFGDIEIYVDGVLLPKSSNSQLINTGDTEFAIGTVTGNGTSSNDYNGFIDEFYIYDVALTALEVADLAALTPAAIPGAIESFGVSPRNRVTAGSSVTLSWDLDRVQSGSDVTIDNGIGIVSVDTDGVGSTSFAAPSVSTTYTLSMTDETGAVLTDETTVIVGAAPLPNIILFLVDDMGWADWEHNNDDTTTGDYATTPISTGSEFYETPAMNTLAQEGMWFRRAYTDSSVCSPTRASILTGQAPARHKITNWITGSGDANMDMNEAEWLKYMPEELREISLSAVLADNGYRTIHVGKWHLGSGGSDSDSPMETGFDVNVGGGVWGTPPTFFADSNDSFRIPNMEPSAPHPAIAQYDYLTPALTTRALEEIEAAHSAGDAFFLYMSHYDPHAPIDAPKDDLDTTDALGNTVTSLGADSYEAKLNLNGGYDSDGDHSVFGGQQNSVYASKIDHLDDSVALLMAKLEDLGIDDDTLFIFYSDNGGWETTPVASSVEGTGGSDVRTVYHGTGGIAGASRQATDVAPLHMGKGYLYEGGIRAPALFWWPGQIPAAQIDDTPIVGRDLYRTILEVANVPLPAGHVVDGHSLAPLLGLSSGDFSRPEGISIHYPHHARNHGGLPGSVLIQGNWKLMYFYNYGGRPAFKGDPAYDGDGDATNPTYVLYDLANDIGETTDLASSEGALQAILQYDLATGLTLQGANYPSRKSDSVEVSPAAGSNPDNVNSDGDAFTAREEAIAGTSDSDAADIISAGISYATFPNLVVEGKAGRTYNLWRKADLSDPDWTLIVTQGPLAADGAVNLSDPTAGGLDKAFYRVEVSL